MNKKGRCGCLGAFAAGTVYCDFTSYNISTRKGSDLFLKIIGIYFEIFHFSAGFTDMVYVRFYIDFEKSFFTFDAEFGNNAGVYHSMNILINGCERERGNLPFKA